MKLLIFLGACGMLCHAASSQTRDPPGPIENFIRTNFVGHPVIHDQQTWIFDPDISLKRRKQFVELNGDKSVYLIERLGLGIDGRADERLAKQRQRDEGHLGGLNYFQP
ncbi:uncharacterized protein LOC114360369 [Ostrinia furnacalis]|uniref:uncharacterized protein LOC114360369 n=1 Tax=Ostrinia furnacalis TaxID=93504 RepID=UPI00103BF004|nr:uncharacterized protein LOC114360369 [Ostrinia furnacalis]